MGFLRHTAQRISGKQKSTTLKCSALLIIGYSPWPVQYPWRVAPQQSSLPFPEQRGKIIYQFVYLQPVLKMGWLQFELRC